jgi:hypothetical protein
MRVGLALRITLSVTWARMDCWTQVNLLVLDVGHLRQTGIYRF